VVQSSAGAERAVVVVGVGGSLMNVRFDCWAKYESVPSAGPLMLAVLPNEFGFKFEPGSGGINSGGAATFVPMLVQPPLAGVDEFVSRLRSFEGRLACESNGDDDALVLAGELVGQAGGGARLPRDVGYEAGGGGEANAVDGGERLGAPNACSAVFRTLVPAD